MKKNANHCIDILIIESLMAREYQTTIFVLQWYLSLGKVKFVPLEHIMLGVERCVIISMMIMCNANAIIEYDRRRSELPSAPLNMDYATTEQSNRVITLAS